MPGLYDLASGWWKLLPTSGGTTAPDAEVDPLYVPLQDEASREHTHRSHESPHQAEHRTPFQRKAMSEPSSGSWWSPAHHDGQSPGASKEEAGGGLNLRPTAMGDRP